MPVRVVAVRDSGVEPECYAPDPSRVLAGDPRQRAWTLHADPTGRFVAGIWEGEPGAWRVQYDEHEEEFCVLVEGRVRIRGDDGEESVFEPGQAFVVPGGFRGVWENLGRVRKYFSMKLPAGGPGGSAGD